ncbi:hypothetical protein M407DRAFT_35130, partial [Tulasnella calospora MUT 4182]
MDHDHNQHQSFQEEHPAQQPTLSGDAFGQNTVPVVMDPSVQQLAHLFGQIINMQTANLQGHRTDLATFTNDIVNRLYSLVGAQASTQDNGTADSSTPKTVRVADPGNF